MTADRNCYAAPGCKRQADLGHSCRGHFERLGTMLREVEDQAAILSAAPSMQQRSGPGGGAPAFTRAPARLDVLVHNDRRSVPAGERPPGPACATCWHGSCIDIRAWIDAYDARATDQLSILDVLHSWARLVREERALSEPDEVTVMSERAVLTRWLEWIVEQDWIDEAYADIRNLLAQLKGVNGTAELRPKSVGLCPTLLEDGECGGRLWPDEGRGEVTCGHCGRIFDRGELRHLGEMLIRQGYVEVFRAEWFTGVPAGTIRRWVAEGRITSQKDDRKLMVAITEVEQIRDRKKRRTRVVELTKGELSSTMCSDGIAG